MSKRSVTFHGGTASVRKSRRVRFCGARDIYCWHTIRPGEEYVRSVMFPNHDASVYDVPVVHVTCAGCALNYIYLDQLDVSPRRTNRIEDA